MKGSIKLGAVVALSCLLTTGIAGTASARTANKTLYPIVFAHGMGGFDDILGYDYWGDDWGVFVLDPCDGFLETTCNGDIDTGQKSFVASVTPLQTSEARGYELYQDILGYMATSGASYVNIVGHSQGGLDLRKAAKLLYTNKARTVVKYGISLSSPHRGSPIAKYVLDLKPGVTSVISALANFYGSVVYGAGNDATAALKQLVYNDYSSTDGITTGMQVFNTAYPNSSTYIARSRSMITAQQGLDMNPALYLVQQGFTNIDGDGYAATDSDNDGAEGAGNGNKSDTDDDGLVGINSAQMGLRLEHVPCWPCLDNIYERTATGDCTNLNAPTSTMMTSHSYVIPQDHIDIIGVGPDTFDEMAFYAALTDYIADNGY
jgi:triacylglycerol esterase/lipase EstA (alpha/beta hydrolase family)